MSPAHDGTHVRFTRDAEQRLSRVTRPDTHFDIQASLHERLGEFTNVLAGLVDPRSDDGAFESARLDDMAEHDPPHPENTESRRESHDEGTLVREFGGYHHRAQHR